MNLKPELLSTMNNLGVTEAELQVLQSRMLSAVTSLEASLNALNAQINTLTMQRDTIATELADAKVTVAKLIDPTVEPLPGPEPEPAPEVPTDNGI